MARQYPLPLPHHEAMDAADFMITSSNRDAAAWVGEWPHWPSRIAVLHGPLGCGKTHLAEIWRRKADAQPLVKAELASVDPDRPPSALLFENADQIAEDDVGEETLFHLFNHCRAAGSFLLLTARHAPAQWGIKLADLRSRLTSIPAVAIHAPDDELLSALLIKQFHDRGIDIGTDVADYLLPRIERSPAIVRALIETLDKASLAEGRRISVALARRIIEDEGFLIP